MCVYCILYWLLWSTLLRVLKSDAQIVYYYYKCVEQNNILSISCAIFLPKIMCNILNIMCYIINIMLPLNITLQYYLSSPLIIMCNILNVMCNTSSQYYPFNITMLHYLSSLCAIFLILFLSCAKLPLTIITLLFKFNYCQIVFADWISYLTYIFILLGCRLVNLLLYLYYSTVYFSIVLFYCYATWHKYFLRDQ